MQLMQDWIVLTVAASSVKVARRKSYIVGFSPGQSRRVGANLLMANGQSLEVVESEEEIARLLDAPRLTP